MPTKGTRPTPESTSRDLLSLAGFQVTVIGRIWVTADVVATQGRGTEQEYCPFDCGSWEINPRIETAIGTGQVSRNPSTKPKWPSSTHY